MKRNFFLLILACAVGTVIFFSKQNETQKSHKVFISKVVDHPALDQTVRGIKDTLAKSNFKNAKVLVESAQANASLANQIANKFVNKNPDIVVGVGTISAQSLAKFALEGQTFLVFSSITDPVTAGLSKSTKNSKNITGVSNFISLKRQVSLFKEVLPGLKKLGFLYNAGEMNSIIILQKLQILSKLTNLTIVPQTLSNTSEVLQAATKLSQNCDAIYVSNDNTVLSAFSGVVKACNTAGIPIFVSDTDIVEQGALLALGANQYQIGVQTGNMVVKILEGKPPKEIPVEYPQEVNLVLNLTVANNIGLKIPPEVINKATKTL